MTDTNLRERTLQVVSPATENDVRFYALIICAVVATPNWFAVVFMTLALLVAIRDARQRTAQLRQQGGDK